MPADPSSPDEPRATAAAIDGFVRRVLEAAGATPDHAASVAQALTEASLRGVDSHGVRLVVHYAKVVRTGRINPAPRLTVRTTGVATAFVDGDNGFGHHASFFAVQQGVEIARTSGIAAVAAINSSHFGAAGCYALAAARDNMVGLAVANSDPIVLPHDGAAPFHGTNPLAFAAPVAGARPYLFDMATSSIPWNRVLDRLTKGLALPPDVVVDTGGRSTTEAARAAALLPLGGLAFGFKGAGLASMIEVLSAVVTGSPHCTELPGMGGPDFATPRRLGHFFIVIDPERFVSRAVYDAGMASYLRDLRGAPARPDVHVMAPGDREWAVEDERATTGIPVAPPLLAQFDAMAQELGVARLETNLTR